MSQASPEAIQKQVKIVIRVFAALAVLTLLTVGASYLNLPMRAAIVVALALAAIKSSLVAAFFMHLTKERKIIFAILLGTIFFFGVLLIYPSLHLF